MEQSRLFSEVPDSVSDWMTAAVAGELKNKSPADFDEYRPASRMSKEHFVVLRTITRKLLSGSNDFQAYLIAVPDRTLAGRGDFGPLRKQQLEIILPEETADKLGKRDESPRHSKICLEAKFGHATGPTRSYKSVTDGQLQDRNTIKIRAVVECKSMKRNDCSLAVTMQEAAMLVAWIREFPGNERRVLVSQDGLKMKVTFAEYGNLWHQYLQDNNVAVNTSRGF
ncbi:hypothetical protein BJX99DRAFT_256180 [Aspergillus californicus]